MQSLTEERSAFLVPGFNRCYLLMLKSYARLRLPLGKKPNPCKSPSGKSQFLRCADVERRRAGHLWLRANQRGSDSPKSKQVKLRFQRLSLHLPPRILKSMDESYDTEQYASIGENFPYLQRFHARKVFSSALSR